MKPWSHEFEFVARLSRLTPTGDDVTRAADLARDALDWERVVSIAARHGVASLVDRAMPQIAESLVPDGIRAEVRTLRLQSTRADLALHHDWLRLCAAFERRGITAVTMKGFYVVHAVYGEIGLRPVGDLDFLVRREDVAAALDVLGECGFRPWEDFEDALRNVGLAHLVNGSMEMGLVSARGAVVDLHWASGPRGLSLPAERLLARTEPFQVAQGLARVVPRTDAIAMLLLHGRKDAWRRLRWLVDVAEWLDDLSSDEYTTVARRLENLGRRSVLGEALLLVESLWGRLPSVCRDLQAAQSPAKRSAVRYYQSVLERDRDWGHQFDRWRPVRMLRDRFGAGTSITSAIASAMRPNYFDWAFVALPPRLRFAYYLVRPLRIAPQLLGKGRSRWRVSPVPSPSPAITPASAVRTAAAFPPKPTGTPLTFVTAVYDSNWESLLGGRGRDIVHYLPSLINIANLGAPLVLYCRAADVQRIDRALAPYFREYRVVPFELEEFELFESFIASKRTYVNDLLLNDRNEVLCFLKSYWLTRTSVESPFGHDRYFWIDAGLTHHGIFPERVGGVELMVEHPASRYYPLNPKNIFTPRLGTALAESVLPGRLLFCALPVRDVDGRNRFASVGEAAFGRPSGSVKIDDHLVGGIFGGYANGIAAVHDAYVPLLRAFLNSKTYALEEQVLSTLNALQPELFSLWRFATWYFHAPGERTGVLDAEAESFYKLFATLATLATARSTGE